MEAGVSCCLCSEHPPPPSTPAQALHSAVPGCARRHALGGRQRKEHSSPCADGPRRAPAAPGPALWPPFLGAILAGVAPCRQGGALMWPWARPVCEEPGFPRPPAPAAGGGYRAPWLLGAPICGLGHVRLPASTLLTVGISIEQQCGFGSEKVTCPAGHTAGGAWTQREGLARRTAVLWLHPCPPDLAPSLAQLTRPAVW